MSEWQDISTAPLDGEHVLLIGHLKRDYPSVGFFFNGTWWAWFHPKEPMTSGMEPTYWMPLPPPPAQEGE